MKKNGSSRFCLVQIKQNNAIILSQIFSPESPLHVLHLISHHKITNSVKLDDLVNSGFFLSFSIKINFQNLQGFWKRMF